MTDRRDGWVVAAAAAALAFTAALSWWVHRPAGVRPPESAEEPVFTSEPAEVMNTLSRLVVVGLPRGQAQQALGGAEAALRQVESRMSATLEGAEIRRFNAAAPGSTEVSEATAHVLGRAREVWQRSDGAFDVTCRPLLTLWKSAAAAGKPPDDSALAAARALTGWRGVELDGRTLTKKLPGAQVDLGGIAKGYGIDQALAALRGAGARGGLVDVGGDLRVFGTAPSGGAWRVGIQHPFREGIVAVMEVRDVAVATSGDYRRFSQIGSRRLSHIVDPRTGRPVDGAASVTVVAGDAETADAWATALSVLGEAGLAQAATQGLEALLVLGRPEQWHVVATPQFHRYVVEGWPLNLE